MVRAVSTIQIMFVLLTKYHNLPWIHSLGVFRTDVSYHDMEEINKMQSIPDLERFLPIYDKKRIYVYYTHSHTGHIFLSCFSSPVTVLYAVCLELTSLNQKEKSCWRCMSRLCIFAEHAASKWNRLLLSCPSSSPSMRLT